MTYSNLHISIRRRVKRQGFIASSFRFLTCLQSNDNDYTRNSFHTNRNTFQIELFYLRIESLNRARLFALLSQFANRRFALCVTQK